MADKPRRVTLKEVGKSGWVKMTPAQYVMEWYSNPNWTAQDFGLYSLVDDLLYANGGWFEFANIEPISRLNRDQFEKSWSKVCSKFNKRGSKVFHSSVLKALREAREAMQNQVDKGFKGSQFRWHSNSKGNSTGNGKGNAEKSRVDKSRKEKNKRKKFVPPTFEEIKAYIQTKKYSVDAKKFYAFFTESDPPWVDSNGKPVRSWKQKIITWSGDRGKKPEPPKTCIVCKKTGRKFQDNEEKKQIWLCEICVMCFKATGWTAWGKLPLAVIERKVQEGKAKLKH